ncbi:hypothetical protein SISNIDRAFT_419149, partial [Sistotremastrum niveocremeum HHB9708]
IHFPARTFDHRDVVIRLIRKGDDGQEHVEVLRSLARGERAFHAGNHCVPMLDELNLGDMTFAVFPFLADSVNCPWFYNFEEVFDFLVQALEGISYLHDNLVAHLVRLSSSVDGPDNTYIAYSRILTLITSCSTLLRRGVSLVTSLTSAIKFRLAQIKFGTSSTAQTLYLGDMELCVRFTPESEPASRKIVGIPVARIGISPSDYGRALVPEMALSGPYCPFKADMWQFGSMLYYMFQPSADILPDLYALIEALKCHDPDGRPTATQALDRVRLMRAQTPADILSEPVPPAIEIQH